MIVIALMTLLIVILILVLLCSVSELALASLPLERKLSLIRHWDPVVKLFWNVGILITHFLKTLWILVFVGDSANSYAAADHHYHRRRANELFQAATEHNQIVREGILMADQSWSPFQAAAAILAQNQEGKPRGVLDLHGLFVQEALEALQERIGELKRSREVNCPSSFKRWHETQIVIVGSRCWNSVSVQCSAV